jgi:membrane peptidoglycan carboxypeptidase
VTHAIREDRTGPNRSAATVVSPRHPRRRRWVRRVVAATAALVVFLGAGLAALLALTPSVDDAPGLVASGLAVHHAPSDDGVIPVRVAAALLATEDSRYYGDFALDPRGAVRGAWGALTRDSSTGGATIELQLAKLLYTPGRSGLGAELEQVGVAIKLDAHFTKHQILAMYLDAAYFGDGAYGITMAARHYFDRPAGDLTWGQASLLAGLVQAPTAYDPHGHLHLALQRRHHVLQRLVATGTLSPAAAIRVAAAPLDPAVPFYG